MTEQPLRHYLTYCKSREGTGLAAQFCQQVSGVHRLGEDLEFVPLHAGLFEKIRGGCLAGEQKDLAIWQSAAGDDCRFDTGHAGHDDVADEHVGLKALNRLDGFLSAEDGARLKACLIQDDREGVRNYLVVICNDYSGFYCG